jgi:hypothetical protein
MKKTLMTLGATILTIAFLHAFRALQNTTISGRIIPPDAADKILLISGTDSARAVIMNGAFAVSVKQGTWRLIIDAIEPYKDVIIERVEAKEGQNTDVGEIKIEKTLDHPEGEPRLRGSLEGRLRIE